MKHPMDFVVGEPLIMFFIGKTVPGNWPDVYASVRGWWQVDINKANGYRLVLARDSEQILGAFRPTDWYRRIRDGLCGFDGEPAELTVWKAYVGKRVPDKYRTPAVFQYLDPED